MCNEETLEILDKQNKEIFKINQKILQKLDELAEENKQLKSELEEVKEQQQKTKEFVKELAEEMVMLLGKFIKEQNKEVFRNWFENTIGTIVGDTSTDAAKSIVESSARGHRLILDSITELNKKLDKVEYEVKKIRDPLHAMRDKNGDFSLFNRVR
ncbi:hypothetical protein C6V80_09760 (plasmid) [Caminibacter pacificus]|uniref:Uncharacterized protein n=1 Tax=Caminibacter pacificus TaxID=1424653 RepID=A0ABX5VXH9_9BACT|nr:hypothetical protein [Caminibacter pacificus]QDD68129.1 hypothetical protein C6V80_09760 [Caminibacter pacificus]